MQKVLTIKRGKEVRTARVFLAVTHQRLDAVIEAAVLAAIDAYRGPDDERVVHMADGRNAPARSPDAPPPGTITRRDLPEGLDDDADDGEGVEVV